MEGWLPRLAPALVAVMAACSSVSHRDDVAERVSRVDVERLRGHVLALDGIGARPVGDAAATEATVDYLATTLRGYGYEVVLEGFTMPRPSRVTAVVAPADDPSAEPRELLLSDSLGPVGRHVMRAATERLAGEGWDVEGYRHTTPADPTPLELVNVLATLPGADPGAPVRELGAHYDTVPFSPGANDNSTGVAIVLEVARLLADAGTEAPVRFVLFGAEECGLIGSRAHVAALRARGEAVAGLLNLDTVGFTDDAPDSQAQPAGVPWFLSLPSEADFVVVAGDWSSGPLGNLFEDAADAYAPELRYASYNRVGGFFPDGHRSDHASYWRAGLPAIFLTDTGEFRSPHYHAPSDRPDTLDWNLVEQLARATLAATLHWAGPAQNE